MVFKPPDWEVHDANAELQLAEFIEAVYGRLPILKDEQHEHGAWQWWNPVGVRSWLAIWPPFGASIALFSHKTQRI